MAASGTQTIQLYYSTTSGTAPVATNLASGELAINITDGKLYYKDNGGTVQTLATKDATSGSFSSITVSGTATLSGGTANGVLYLNGSKVATSGSALTFDGTNLGIGTTSPAYAIDVQRSSASSAISSTSAGTGVAPNLYFQRARGTLASPTVANGNAVLGVLYFNGYDGTSYINSAQLLVSQETTATTGIVQSRFIFNNQNSSGVLTERMRIDSSGNVGIGTASPTSKLHVFTRADAGASPNTPVVTIEHQDINSVGTGGTNGGKINFVNIQQNNTGWAADSIWGRVDFYGSQPTSGVAQLGASILAAGNGTNSGQSLATYLAFYTSDASNGGNNVERMRLDASGNLGLGVTPSAWSGFKALDFGVVGSIGNFSVQVQIGANYYWNGSNYIYKTTNAASYYNQNAGAHVWYNAPSGTAGNAITFTQAMTLDASGNLVVGQTSAGSAKLTVNSTSTMLQVLGKSSAQQSSDIQITRTSSAQTILNGPNIYMEDGTANNTIAIQNGQGNLQFWNYGAGSWIERARIDSSGNLGLGVTPSAWGTGNSNGNIQIAATKFISSTGDAINFASNIYQSSGNKYASNGYASLYYQYQGQHVWNIAPSGTAGNAITFTQAMTLDASGNLLVGTTSRKAQEKVNFTYDGSTAQGLAFNDTYATAGGTTAVNFYRNGSIVGSISTTLSATTYNTSSDIRLKNDQGLATQSRIADVKIHNFTWKADGSESVGVFAQELAEVIPEAVTKGTDELNEQGMPVQPWGVDYSKLVPDLILAVQQLKAEVESLKSQLKGN